MSTPPRPRLKSITTTPSGPSAAPQAVDTTAVGEPKGAARKGVPASPDPHTGDVGNPTPERPSLRVYAPPVYRHHYDGARWSKRYGATPTAAYACSCGHTRTATGPIAVAALVAEYEFHRATCPLRTNEEGRAAA
ncbi:hypothetical protein OHB06_29410 [Streptomyces sp. NBC_01604]|uniref:hypothetical protein n=1 Tax=Streptomyces sp. NBC_01604 TaxID=2975894 RepID=UPI00386D6CC0